MSELIDPMLAWLAAHEGPLSYAAFGVAAMLEYLVPPLPGDAIALFGIFLCVSAGWSDAGVYLALNVGSVIGGLGAYAAGVWLRDHQRRPALLRGPRAEAALSALSERYRRHGAVYLALNRFVPALRAFFFVAAGIAGLSPWRVALYGLVSALVWNAVLLGIGHAARASYEDLASGLGIYGVVVLVTLAIAAGVWASRRAARRVLRERGTPPSRDR